MRLARDLNMTRAELRRRMPHREFVEWIAFYNVEAELRRKAEAKNKRGR